MGIKFIRTGKVGPKDSPREAWAEVQEDCPWPGEVVRFQHRNSLAGLMGRGGSLLFSYSLFLTHSCLSPAGFGATSDQSQRRLIALPKLHRGRNEAFRISSLVRAYQPGRYGPRRSVTDESNTQSHPNGVQEKNTASSGEYSS